MKAINSIPARSVTVRNLQAYHGLKTGKSLFHGIIMILVGGDLQRYRVQLPDLLRINQKLKQTLRTLSKCLSTSDRMGHQPPLRSLFQCATTLAIKILALFCWQKRGNGSSLCCQVSNLVVPGSLTMCSLCSRCRRSCCCLRATCWSL